MKRPSLARRVHDVEHLAALEIHPLDLALKGGWRPSRDQLSADRADNRKSGAPECVLDLAVDRQLRSFPRFIEAERPSSLKAADNPKRQGTNRRWPATARRPKPLLAAVRWSDWFGILAFLVRNVELNVSNPVLPKILVQ